MLVGHHRLPQQFWAALLSDKCKPCGGIARDCASVLQVSMTHKVCVPLPDAKCQMRMLRHYVAADNWSVGVKVHASDVHPFE